MIDLHFNPALVMLLGAALLAVTTGTVRKAIALILPLATLLLMHLAAASYSTTFMGYAVQPLRLDNLGLLFASTFAVIAFAGMLYAVHHFSTREMVAATAYAGSAIGVSLSGDFINLFIYWEVMAIASTVIVLSGNSTAAYRAAFRYAIVHLLAGTLLLVGIAALVSASGDASLRLLTLDAPYTWLILAGFLINTGAPPLSAWVSDAYPEASPGGAVFLCAFTTKVAVFALLSVFAGTEILIPIGLYMIGYGIIYALLENNVRRILSYGIISQVGFMVVACGIGSELAVNGAAAHASIHIIYKALLMMSAGSVLLMTGKRLCTELGSFYSSMKVTALCGMVGIATISAVPFTSGFVSKSLINASALEAGDVWLWAALLAATAGVLLHVGIILVYSGMRFPWLASYNQDKPVENVNEAPPNMQIAMLILVFLSLLLGVFPEPLYALLPHALDYQVYTVLSVVKQTQLLIFSAIAFFMLLPFLQRTRTLSLDLDWFYRIPIPRLLAGSAHYIAAQYQSLVSACNLQDYRTKYLVQVETRLFAYVPLSALLASALAVLLTLALFLYY